MRKSKEKKNVDTETLSTSKRKNGKECVAKEQSSKGTPAPKNKNTAQANAATGKNVSKNIKNGTFVITNDENFYDADGKSKKIRMATVVDSNRNDELGIVKYTTSERHGKEFVNDKGFVGYGDKIYTLDNDGNPIKIDGKKFVRGKAKRDITIKTANEIKKNNLKESRYKSGNRANLRNLKGRRKKKNGS